MEQPWQPANAVEAALRDALTGGDQERYYAALAESVLLVPVEAAGGAGKPPRLASRRLDDGLVVVPAYTSPAGLARPEAERLTGQQLPIPFALLAGSWPDPRWVLAVNPGLPIATHLSGAELGMVVATVFRPVNDAEQALAIAGEPEAALAAIAAAELHLPVRAEVPLPPDLSDPHFPWWRWESGTGLPPAVPVFTSRRRLLGCLGVAEPEIASVPVDLAVLAGHWPDRRWSLLVNPGSPYAVTFRAEQLERLATAPTEIVTLQLLLPHELVSSYLEDGYAIAAGVVHRRPPEPRPLPELYRDLGLVRTGSPFAVTDEWVHLLRWRADPELARQWARAGRPRTESVQLPTGAQLVLLRADGTERLVATYHPEHHRWITAG